MKCSRVNCGSERGSTRSTRQLLALRPSPRQHIDMQRRQSKSPTPPPRKSVAQLRAERARLDAELARAEALEQAEMEKKETFEGAKVIVPASPSPRESLQATSPAQADLSHNLRQETSASRGSLPEQPPCLRFPRFDACRSTRVLVQRLHTRRSATCARIAILFARVGAASSA